MYASRWSVERSLPAVVTRVQHRVFALKLGIKENGVFWCEFTCFKGTSTKKATVEAPLVFERDPYKDECGTLYWQGAAVQHAEQHENWARLRDVVWG